MNINYLNTFQPINVIPSSLKFLTISIQTPHKYIQTYTSTVSALNLIRIKYQSRLYLRDDPAYSIIFEISHLLYTYDLLIYIHEKRETCTVYNVHNPAQHHIHKWIYICKFTFPCVCHHPQSSIYTNTYFWMPRIKFH